MRKICSMVLMSALLVVTSVPLLPAAAKFCALDDGAMQMHAAHDHGMVLNLDFQTARIECGCGCHRSVDSLPNLLAPHVVSLAGLDVGLVIASVADVNLPVLKPRLLPFPVPPPRFS
ncbi:MAG: hypothetical protein Q9M27_05995 [Mariprofundaceae bacterium]|nr:hypothetical protein [Mariprofundaceae bacterium]